MAKEKPITNWSDNVITRFLLSESTLRSLEEVLSQELPLYENHQQREEVQKTPLSLHELQHLVPQVKNRADVITGVSEVSSPVYDYHSWRASLRHNPFQAISALAFSTLTASLHSDGGGILAPAMMAITGVGISYWMQRTQELPLYIKHPHASVTLPKKSRQELINDMTELYLQHVLAEKGMISLHTECFNSPYSIISSGMPRAITRHIAQNWAQEEKDESFLVQPIQNACADMVFTYDWIRKELGKEGDTPLRQFKSYESFPRQWDDYSGWMMPHSIPREDMIGNTFSRVLVEQQGIGVYRDMITGDFALPQPKRNSVSRLFHKVFPEILK